MKWEIYGLIRGSKYLGTVEAETEEEAKRKAYKELAEELYVSVCHQCSNEVGEVEIDELHAEPA